MNQKPALTFDWLLPENIAELLQVQNNSGTTWSHSREFFEESLAYKRVLLAKADGIPIAYLLYEIIWGNTAFLSLLKVIPDYQRQGVGKAMIENLEKRLVSLGFNSYVTSSDESNQHTKKLFPDLGFAAIGKLEMMHGPEIFYLKKLT